MKKIIAIVFLVSVSLSSLASVNVLFHPYDPTLETIAAWFARAEKSIDIAMYNIDVVDSSPLIRYLKSAEMQKRLQSGSLKVRMIFEGYATAEENAKKMAALESLGIDVRYLGIEKKVHHKFAVIDVESNHPLLITGSANWSLGSRNNYNENIMFLDNEPEVTVAYASQFSFLWNMAKEFGRVGLAANPHLPQMSYRNELRAYFTLNNYHLDNQGLASNSEDMGYTITRQLVAAIDSARSQLEIATTRVKLRPIYDALLRAAQRGVDIKIVITMGEYEFPGMRSKQILKNCPNPWVRKCSSGENYASFLSRSDFQGHEKIAIRVKWFDLNMDNYLLKQMHSKYMVVDGERVLSGSFNWSYSSEFENLENVLDIDGRIYPNLKQSFRADFARLWNMNRNQYQPLVDRVQNAFARGVKVDCRFEPMTLEYNEIDNLMSLGASFGKKTMAACN